MGGIAQIKNIFLCIPTPTTSMNQILNIRVNPKFSQPLKFKARFLEIWTSEFPEILSIPSSPVAEGPNLAMSGNSCFSAFFSSPYHVIQESIGCRDYPLEKFSKSNVVASSHIG